MMTHLGGVDLKQLMALAAVYTTTSCKEEDSDMLDGPAMHGRCVL